MAIRYKVGTDRVSVVAVECQKEGWPNEDADGVKQYNNTHFKTEAEAWEWLVRNADLGVKCAGADVARAKKALAEAQATAGDRADEYAATIRNFENWKQQKERR